MAIECNTKSCRQAFKSYETQNEPLSSFAKNKNKIFVTRTTIEDVLFTPGNVFSRRLSHSERKAAVYELVKNLQPKEPEVVTVTSMEHMIDEKIRACVSGEALRQYMQTEEWHTRVAQAIDDTAKRHFEEIGPTLVQEVRERLMEEERQLMRPAKKAHTMDPIAQFLALVRK